MTCTKPGVRCFNLLSYCVLFGCLLASTSAWATTAGNIIIRLADSRDASDVTVTLTATDAVTGVTYSDWEAMSAVWRGTAVSYKNESVMTWSPPYSSNALDEYYVNYSYGLTYSLIWLVAMSPDTYYTNVRVTVRATINGYCHEDYEDLAAWSGERNLSFNGNNATWDGSCYRGDLLTVLP